MLHQPPPCQPSEKCAFGFVKIVILVVRTLLHFSNKQFTLLSRSDNLPSLSDNLRTIMSLIESVNYVNMSLDIKPHVKDEIRIGMMIVMMIRMKIMVLTTMTILMISLKT